MDLEENCVKRNRLYDYLNKVANSIPKTTEELNAWIVENHEWWNTKHSGVGETQLFFRWTVR